MKRLILAGMIIATVASLSFGQSAATQKAIEANNKRFVEAFNKGDAAAVAGFYAADAKVLPPNGPIIEGKPNIQEFWQGLIKIGAKIQALDTVQVDSRGDLAYELGKYSFTIPQAGGQSVTDQGKYIVIWKRQGGTWKLVQDIWNTNSPLPGP
ncbi:MAG: YybH family protein [Pyrinomonadaceae bacterium]